MTGNGNEALVWSRIKCSDRGLTALACQLAYQATCSSHTELFFKALENNYFPASEHYQEPFNLQLRICAPTAAMGTGKKEANRKIKQGKVGDGMANVKTKGENFYRYFSSPPRDR